MTDGEVFTNNASSSAPRLTYTREFTNTNWQALYVPFAMNYADWQADFDVARINNMHQYDDNQDGTVDRTELEVILLNEGSAIEANCPYLIRAKETGKKTITLTDATLEASAANSIDCSSVNTLYTFTGTYTGVPGADMVAGGYYALSGGELKQAASEAAGLGTFRWYMKAESRNASAEPLPARMQVRVVDPSAGGTTGIETATTPAPAAVEIYTMDGRKAGRFGSTNEARKQLPAGLYLVNGKKVLF